MKRNRRKLVPWTLVILVSFSFFPVNVLAGEPLVNLFLFETGIRDALNEISVQTGINVIPDQTVTGFVTADLQDVPLEKALRIILIGGGFTYRKIDDFYFVGLPDPRSATFKELVETEIITLRNVTVSQVVASLPAFLTPYIKGDPNEQFLTITASPVELERIKGLIAQVDRAPKQVEIRVLVTEVSSEAAKEIGIDLWKYSAEAGQTKNTNWLSSFGFVGNLLSVETNIYGHLLTSLKLLEEQRKAVIHADPQILVSSGQEAKLFVGDRQILLIQGSEATAARIERVEVGVTLKVKPTITGAGEILVDITPEISHFVSDKKPNLVVKESSMTTSIRLQDGQTALLAGMTITESVDSTKKVPILGDIPLIRWLFRSEVEKAEEKELLIFVTPIIH